MSYFIEGLNYTLSNEDTYIEQEILESGGGNVFAIAGSGARVLPLLAKNPQTVYVSDLSQQQLFLTQLRLQAALQLDYDNFLFFMGYRGGVQDSKYEHNDRYELFLKLDLTKDCASFWEDQKDTWCPHGFVHLGSWERHFNKLSAIFRKTLRINIMEIFNAQTIEEQRELYEKHFKKTAFKWFLRIFLSEYAFNKYLYKGAFPGGKDRKSEELPIWKFFHKNITRIFEETLVRKNYFFQLIFLGKIYFEEGLPLEAHRSTIEQIKKSNTKVVYQQGDLRERLQDAVWDFISLSDTISYLPQDYSNNILQTIAPNMNEGGKIVIRSFLRGPQSIDERGFIREPKLEEWAFKQDFTPVYTFNIYSKGQAH